MNLGRVSTAVLFWLFSIASGLADEQTAPPMTDAAPAADESTPAGEEAAPVRHIVHELKIVAHDESVITQSRASELVAALNSLVVSAGPLCANISFALAYPVVYDGKLGVTGEDSDLEKSVKSNDPTANVFVVDQIDDCAGVQAAGCTAVGAGPMIVIDEHSSRASVVWLHERGHAMGLGHVAQGVMQENASSDVQANVMYWLALDGATKLDNVSGVTNQCKAYLNTAKNGVVAQVEQHVAARAALIQLAADPLIPSGPPSTLTPAATTFFFGKDSPAWIHGPPLEAIAKLSQDDVKSIADTILATKPLPEWAHMLTVIAYRAEPRFLDIVTYVLNLAPPTVPAASDTSTPQENALRDGLLAQKGALDRAKLNIPYSLGIYGYKTDDPKAAQLLASFMDPNRAARLFNESGDYIATKSAPRYLGLAASNSGNDNVGNIGATAQTILEPGDDKKLFGDRSFVFRSDNARENVMRAAPLPLSIGPERTGVINQGLTEGRTLGLDAFLTKQR
jgi:hypothetical protein